MAATLATVALLLAQAPSISASELIEEHAREMPQSLFYAASEASGFWYCDRRLKKPQARRFDRIYGVRVLRLAAAIEQQEGLGWAPDDIIVTVCSRPTSQQRARSLREFDRELLALEAQYVAVGHH